VTLFFLSKKLIIKVIRIYATREKVASKKKAERFYSISFFLSVTPRV